MIVLCSYRLSSLEARPAIAEVFSKTTRVRYAISFIGRIWHSGVQNCRAGHIFGR